MFDDQSARRAASILIGHWREESRLDRLPPACAPATRAEGYRVQRHWQDQSSQPLAGWKIAATSIAGQKHIGVDGPLADGLGHKRQRRHQEQNRLPGADQ